MEKITEVNLENKEKPKNPNRIHELLSMGNKLPTSPDKVYRGVQGSDAIKDLFESGVVRNKYSAGISNENRWGESVYWSKGRDGGYHPMNENKYVIEAPLDIAQERVVTKEDVTAIYVEKSGEVIDILKSEKKSEEPNVSQSESKDLDQQRIIKDENRMIEIRNRLGI